MKMVVMPVSYCSAASENQSCLHGGDVLLLFINLIGYRSGQYCSSRFLSRDSAIVAPLAEITIIVTRNFFHPKRGSIPACLVSDSMFSDP